MTRLRLKYVHEFIDVRGKLRRVFPKAGHKRVTLPGLPGSTEFMDAYQTALSQSQPVVIGASRTQPGTVDEAVARYLGSGAFHGLAETTRRDRLSLLDRFRAQHGDKRLRKLEPQHVARLIGKLKPFAQRNMLKALRALTSFALAEGLIESDPTVGVKLARVRDSGGFTTWEEAHIAQYRAYHPLGTQARLALELLYGTMQRRGDAVRLGRQHIREGVLSLRQSKTGTQVDLPVLPELQTAIDAMPADRLTFLVLDGKPFTAATFGKWFERQCRAAGLPKGLSAHGLRKAGATRLAEAGATAAEIMAWGGWKTLSEVQRYTQAASRKRLAQQARRRSKRKRKWLTAQSAVANVRKSAVVST